MNDSKQIPQDLNSIEVDYNDNNMMNKDKMLMEIRIKLTIKKKLFSINFYFY